MNCEKIVYVHKGITYVTYPLSCDFFGNGEEINEDALKIMVENANKLNPFNAPVQLPVVVEQQTIPSPVPLEGDIFNSPIPAPTPAPIPAPVQLQDIDGSVLQLKSISYQINSISEELEKLKASFNQTVEKFTAKSR